MRGRAATYESTLHLELQYWDGTDSGDGDEFRSGIAELHQFDATPE
jgi:hypothetical protein